LGALKAPKKETGASYLRCGSNIDRREKEKIAKGGKDYCQGPHSIRRLLNSEKRGPGELKGDKGYRAGRRSHSGQGGWKNWSVFQEGEGRRDMGKGKLVEGEAPTGFLVRMTA